MSLQYLADFESAESHLDEIWATAWIDKVVLSASLDGEIRLWDSSNGTLLSIAPKSHSLGITSLSTTKDGGKILTNSLDGSVFLWKIERTELDPLEKNDQIQEDEALPGPKPTLRAELILLESKDTLSTSKLAGSKGKGKEAYCSAIHPSGEFFATSGIEGGISIYSTNPFGEIVKYLKPKSKSSNAVSFGMKIAFSQDGDLVACGSNTGQVSLFKFSTGQLLRSISSHSLPVRALSFTSSKDNLASHLLIGSDDRILTIHDVKQISTGNSSGNTNDEDDGQVAALKGHQGWILDVQSSDLNERIVATSSSDNSIKLWDLTSIPKLCVSTQTETKPIWSISWCPSTNNTSDENGNISGDGKLIRQTEEIPRGFVSASQDGKLRWYRSAGVAPPE